MAKLKPRARIIRTIGDQLISGPEAAIIELVKNSYDAEATYAKVKFEYSDTEGFSIVISDDGHGMTYDDIMDNWLEPATDEKVKNQWSRNQVRRLLGAKGIGRFAVSRLGEISLLTATAENPKSGNLERSSICVDWSSFTAEKYLEDIELDIIKENVEKRTNTGVEIEVSQLREVWTKKQLERLIIELRRLSHPRKEDKFSIYLDIDCFNENNSKFDGTTVFSQQNSSLHISIESTPETKDRHLIQPYEVGEITDYRLEGEFLSDGAFHGVFQIQRGDNAVQSIELPPLALQEGEVYCGPVKIRLNIFDKEPDSVEKLFGRMQLNFSKFGVKNARKILRDFSGVSISRNGFRVRPYGDPDYDWLGLQAKRVQEPSKRLGSDQVSGYVEIEDEFESGIIEKSSREGLEENGAYRRLKSLIYQLLPHVEERRFEFREKAGIGRKPATNLDNAREASKLKQVSKALEKVPEEYRAKLVAAIEQDATAINDMLDEVDSYQKLLQSRSALGLVVAEVIHEGRRRLDPMLTSVKTLKADHKHAFEDSKIGKLYRRNFPTEIETLLSGGTALAKLFKRLDPISGRRRGRPANFKAAEVLNDALSILQHKLDSDAIEVKCNFPLDIKCYGYREDLNAAFLNIIENAVHWLSTIEGEERLLVIDVETDKDKIFIFISNNGPEIDEAYQGRLFDAGFSLKSDGNGLGLAIAREACRASKGDLYLDTDAINTTFIIDFPLGG